MSRLFEAIKFRHLTSQLDAQELRTFLQRMIQRSPDLVLTALFQHFAKTPPTRNTSDALQNTNDMISDIIQQRRNKHEQQSATVVQKRKLDKLPSVLIAETATFLSQRSYYRLLRSCRAGYLACCQPNKMTTLWMPFAFAQSWDGHTFPFAKYLWFQLEGLPFMPNLSQLGLTELDTLRIDAYLSWERPYQEEREALCNFVKSDCINFDAIQSIYLEHGRYDAVHHQQIRKLLAKCNNLQTLRLGGLECTGADDWILKLPRLKALMLYAGNEDNREPFATLANQLESVSIEWAHNIDDYSSLNLAILKELRLEPVNASTIGGLFHQSSETSLQKVSLSCIYMAASVQSMVTDIITCSKSLSYLHVDELCAIEVDDYLQSIVPDDYEEEDEHAWMRAEAGKTVRNVLSGIEIGLRQTVGLKRKAFKIHIEAACQYDEREELLLWFDRITRLLANSVEHFMFIWTGMTKDAMKEASEKIGMLENVNVRTETEYDANRLVITNKGCFICGYHEAFQTDNRYPLRASKLL